MRRYAMSLCTTKFIAPTNIVSAAATLAMDAAAVTDAVDFSL